MNFIEWASFSKIFIYYLITISIIGVIITLYDKWASKNKADSRVRESTLFLISILGGSLAMFITMILIRHKTKHLKFMVGIPLIILLQIIGFFLVNKYI